MVVPRSRMPASRVSNSVDERVVFIQRVVFILASTPSCEYPPEVPHRRPGLEKMTTFAGVLVRNIGPGGQIKPTLLDAGPVYVASTGRNSPFVIADVVCMDVFSVPTTSFFWVRTCSFGSLFAVV